MVGMLRSGITHLDNHGRIIKNKNCSRVFHCQGSQKLPSGHLINTLNIFEHGHFPDDLNVKKMIVHFAKCNKLP